MSDESSAPVAPISALGERVSRTPSAARIPAPSRMRDAVDFASIRASSSSTAPGISGRTKRSFGGSAKRIRAITAIACSPPNGDSPVRHSKSTAPSANTSTAGVSSRSPRACSGAMYAGVPSTTPVLVIAAETDPRRAMPKSSSATLSTAPPRRNRLLGLRSRWTTPRACADASASAAQRRSVRLSATVSDPRWRRCARSSPSSHSITRKGWPAGVTPWARYATMPACWSSARISASRAKRASSAGRSLAPRSLTATTCPVRPSRAR